MSCYVTVTYVLLRNIPFSLSKRCLKNYKLICQIYCNTLIYIVKQYKHVITLLFYSILCILL